MKTNKDKEEKNDKFVKMHVCILKDYCNKLLEAVYQAAIESRNNSFITVDYYSLGGKDVSLDVVISVTTVQSKSQSSIGV